ncbi:MAG: serine O-acetyltransferase [Planctomycetota bacterium]|nr:MAG: serine O-acetyltransferase [Planctomycetota bacterium]REJ96281.1 MAG: serine O-acetyltransferase [Planctomycetota bacterium]REK22253.1 MAG: serine O-acetyltransferase [Planctomycetota bacterium]REK27435.1 MAG: serine O-acetyltransferase [Planctomycetota bacterium]
MSETSASSNDPIWQGIREEVQAEISREPILASFLHATILNHQRLEDALSFILAGKLQTLSLPDMLVRELIDRAFAASPQIGASIRQDLEAVRQRDPASHGYSEPFLYFKGFHALQSYRIGHWLWQQSRRSLAVHLQSRISEVFNVDIHPAARIGCGIMIDHGTSVVIGETAVVEDNVSMLHEVTLGGTGKELGQRHPKVRHGVLIGAGAKVLGNIEIGAGAKIGAGSVVLDDVPPHFTVAGVPAEVVGRSNVGEPALEMDQSFPHHHGEGSGI